MLHLHLRGSLWVLPLSKNWAYLQAMQRWPRTARGYATGKGWGPGSADAGASVEALIQLHLTLMISHLLVGHTLYICVYLELHPLQVRRDGLQRLWLPQRWWWCICIWLLLVPLLLLPCQTLHLCLPWHTIFFYKGPVNGRPDKLCGIHRHPIKLAKPVIKAGNPSALLDFSGSTGFLGGMIPAN